MGKTALLKACCGQEVDFDVYNQTNSMDYYKQHVTVGNQRVALQLWDTVSLTKQARCSSLAYHAALRSARLKQTCSLLRPAWRGTTA